MDLNILTFVVDDGIKQSAIRQVESAIEDTRGEHLFLVLESYGGDPFSAVAIMNLLQSRFSKITTVIPKYAKSAGTLMALGTDEIYMSETSSLGPLDLPIEHPMDGSRISALDVQQTLTTISSLTDSIADERYNFLRNTDDKKASKKEAAHLALQFATEFVLPIVKQIDPYHLQKAHRELKIGLYYAIDMLGSRMLKSDYKQVGETARNLVNSYPAHEYSIFRAEARESLKLKVHDLEKMDHCKLIMAEYGRYSSRTHSITYNIIKVPDKTPATKPSVKKQNASRKKK